MIQLKTLQIYNFIIKIMHFAKYLLENIMSCKGDDQTEWGLIVFQEKDVNIVFMTEMKGLPANISEVSIH